MRERIFQQPSVMTAQQHFSQVPSAEIPRSRFDRSHGLKTTFDAGELVPVFVDEVLPGDTFDMESTAFARLATPLKPIMDNLYLDTHFWFVPYRLLWQNWERFCGERVTPDDDPSTLTVPTVAIDIGSTTNDGTHLFAYMGIPYNPAAGGSAVINVSALPFRAYALIYNEWYRDQNLQDPVDFVTTDGPDVDTNTTTLLRRGKRHDYFTSCLPWPQKGDPIGIPIGDYAPVLGIGVSGEPSINPTIFTQTDGTDLNNAVNPRIWATNVVDEFIAVAEGTADSDIPNIYADLSQATAVTVNDLRTAFQIQKLMERDARGGTRYIEVILSHFGVRSDDARLQRPEYLGGGTSRVNINPIASTVGSTEAPQANLAAVGTVVGNARFRKSFTEHGIIIGLVNARADLTYQQGAERLWWRQSRYDFYWPALAHLGEQAVLQRELVTQGNALDEEVFGYQERYAEYRYKPSRITGKFNSTVAANLDVWHLGQEFSYGTGYLTSAFIEDNPPIDRVIAVPSEPHFLADIWFDLKCDRPMPVYSVPGLIDHF